MASSSASARVLSSSSSAGAPGSAAGKARHRAAPLLDAQDRGRLEPAPGDGDAARIGGPDHAERYAVALREQRLLRLKNPEEAPADVAESGQQRDVAPSGAARGRTQCPARAQL